MPKLFMLLLGCKPKQRNTEQHDTLFAVGDSLKDLVPQVLSFWPDAGKIHIDAWREVTNVNGYAISVAEMLPGTQLQGDRLFFLNLGGYKKNEFDEFHYKVLAVSADKAEAVRQAKQTAFYKHMGFKGAESHIDEKYGVDVDDIFQIEEILPKDIKEKYFIQIEPTKPGLIAEDEVHLGYFKLNAL